MGASYDDFDKNQRVTEEEYANSSHNLPNSLVNAIHSTKKLLPKIEGLKNVYVCLLTRSTVIPVSGGLNVRNTTDKDLDLGFRGLDCLKVATGGFSHSLAEGQLSGNQFRTFRCFPDYFQDGSFVLRRCDGHCVEGAPPSVVATRLCIKRYGKPPECLCAPGYEAQDTLDKAAAAYFLANEAEAKSKYGNTDEWITLVAVGASDDPTFPAGRETVITASYLVFSTTFPFDFSRGDWLIGGLINSVLEALLRGHQDVLEHNHPWRRSALRTAVSAIMGRNMSHNIGSHVLARYAGKMGEEPKPPEVNCLRLPDNRSDFLSYLQRRMDFLAEIATSDKAHWSQPLSLPEQLRRLNYKNQIERFKVNGSIERYEQGYWQESAPVLLSFITGKENLLANVDYSGEDFLFACPGGEVGVHALYVILENIIRNSARHGSSDKGIVTLEVKAEIERTGGLIRLEIIDRRSRLNCDGTLLNSDASQQATAEEDTLRASKSHSILENGTRRKLAALHRNINSILHDEPFLNSDGSPNPLYWGLREMQICAQYLRALPLSELEGTRPQLPVLEANVHHNGNADNCCLKYVLYLEPARLAAVMAPKDMINGGLRARGIALIPDHANLDDIIAQSRGFGFLVYQDHQEISKALEVPEKKAALPVRVLGRIDVDALLALAHSEVPGAGVLDWMECLYRRWAEQCRDLREACWKHKPMYGLAVYAGTGEALKWEFKSIHPVGHGDIGWQSYGKDRRSISIWAMKNLGGGEGSGIGAAWIDHGGKADLSTKDGAGFGQAGQLLDDAEEPPRHWICVELARSESPHTVFLNSLGQRSGWEILAAALPRVAVLDERVQAEAGKDLGKGAKLHDVWPCMGVWVPNKDSCNLDAPPFPECQHFLMEPTPLIEQFPIDFLVIHLTILERLHRDKKNEMMKDTLDELVAGTQAEKAHIVIVTGRGVPSIAQGLNHDGLDHVRYLPISVLLESLTVRPSKLALMRVLWSAGRPH